MKQLLLLLMVITFQASLSQVTISGPMDAQTLIQNVLIGNPNFPATNFAMANANQFNGPNSVAVFNSTNPNIIPFSDGIILSTGDASAIVDLPLTVMSSGENSWLGDTELETITAITNLSNASSIQFDFVADVPAVSFDFMMASEEYNGVFECSFSDVFAFIIHNNTTGTSENVAVVPGSNIPISVTTVNNSANCPSNTAYFDHYNTVGFAGQTVVFVLTGDLVIGDNYTVKIVIADQGDSVYDSALFVRNSSFGAYPTIDQEPLDIVIEDTDNDGTEVFDLTVNQPLMLGAINTAVYSFDFYYYTTLADAQANVNPIANPQAYTNTADLEDIYVSMQNSYTGTDITTQFKISIDGTLLTVDETALDSAALYPNPVVDMLNIEGHTATISQIEVYAINGQLLSSDTFNNVQRTTVDFSKYTSGIYLIKVVTDKGSIYRRVLK